MANFHQVFKNEPACIHARSYCEYEGDVEVVCGKCKHGTLFCFKCSEYEPKGQETNTNVQPNTECAPEAKAGLDGECRVLQTHSS